jgi:hypothetical protein
MREEHPNGGASTEPPAPITPHTRGRPGGMLVKAGDNPRENCLASSLCLGAYSSLTVDPSELREKAALKLGKFAREGIAVRFGRWLWHRGSLSLLLLVSTLPRLKAESLSPEYLSLPVLLQHKLGSGTGCYLRAGNYLLFLTARHVLFRNEQPLALRSSTATLLSYTRQKANGPSLSLTSTICLRRGCSMCPTPGSILRSQLSVGLSLTAQMIPLFD